MYLKHTQRLKHLATQYVSKGGFPILSKHIVVRCGSVDGSDIWQSLPAMVEKPYV